MDIHRHLFLVEHEHEVATPVLYDLRTHLLNSRHREDEDVKELDNAQTCDQQVRKCTTIGSKDPRVERQSELRAGQMAGIRVEPMMQSQLHPPMDP